MARTSDGTRLGAPGKGAPKRAERGRRCDFVGCTTVLSTYNSSGTCWLHGGSDRRHATYGTR